MQFFEHYILTLFNVDRGFDKDNKRNDLKYLEKRFEIFELVTVPSILAQISRNFTWFVFFDSGTPDEFKTRVDEISKKLTNFFPIYVDREDQVLPFLKNNLSPKTKYLVTTNLDNDDALHKNFVQITQSNFRDEQLYFINFPLGYMLRKDGLLMREFLSSPFHTIVEPVSDELLTCLSVPHYRLYSLFLKGVPVYQIPANPLWLQLVHDTNVVNKLDVNAVLTLDLGKINDFGILTIPPHFKELYNLELSRLKFCLRLIKDKKKPYRLKTKLIIYTLFSFLAPLRIQLKYFSQSYLKKQTSNSWSSSKIRELLRDFK